MPTVISRRESLKCIGVGAAGLAAAWPGLDALAAPVAASRRPNVLFIAVDDLRPMLGCYWNAQAVTPQLDAFARTGIVFERAYCQVATCGASRASLLTGLRPLAMIVPVGGLSFIAGWCALAVGAVRAL